MKKSNHEQISNFISEVQNLKDELEFLQEQKSRIKLQLFYDTENQDLIDKLNDIKNQMGMVNEKIKTINTQLLSVLNDTENEQ